MFAFRYVLLLTLLACCCRAQPPAFELPSPATDADYYYAGKPPPAQVELGRLLFFDKILSGNKNISCATCHHPKTHTGDALAMSIGQGGRGLGPSRQPSDGLHRALARTPRNAQPLYNLGSRYFTVLFFDGRVRTSQTFRSGFHTPVHNALPMGLDNVLAAQALFPLTSHREMAGEYGENPVANAIDRIPPQHPEEFLKAWAAIEERLQSIPAYVDLFEAAYPGKPLSIVGMGNAIAAFITTAFRADQSPYDLGLRGDPEALTTIQQVGQNLFYGKAGCAGCHSGVFQTDLKFHSIGLPQIGPGKEHGLSFLEDYGREGETRQRIHRYTFRTPSLRNVELTGPYGHNGAYTSLEEIVRHHLDPAASLKAYATTNRVILPAMAQDDFRGLKDYAFKTKLAAFIDIEPQPEITEEELDALLAFLKALTDPRSLDQTALVPDQVPSGLPVDR